MDADKDIEELERMLGRTRAAYQGLRHRTPLRTAPVARPRPYRRLALVATMLLAVSIATFGALDRMAAPVPPVKPSSLAFSRPDAALDRMRAAPDLRLTGARPRLSVRIRLPRRPMVSKG